MNDEPFKIKKKKEKETFIYLLNRLFDSNTFLEFLKVSFSISLGYPEFRKKAVLQ